MFGDVVVIAELLVLDWIVEMLVLLLLWLCFVNLNIFASLSRLVGW